MTHSYVQQDSFTCATLLILSRHRTDSASAAAGKKIDHCYEGKKINKDLQGGENP